MKVPKIQRIGKKIPKKNRELTRRFEAIVAPKGRA